MTTSEAIKPDPAAPDPGADDRAVAPLPLVLDLDHTLIRCDALQEMAVVYVRRNPLGVFRLVQWLAGGRANLKRRLAERVELDVETLPVNEELAAFAAAENDKGRPVVLATAADETYARQVADRFPFINTVIASDGVTNMKGATKADVLRARYPGGFTYAGDSAADLPVWQKAGGIILASASPAIERKAERLGPVEARFARPSRLRAFIKSARPHQWAKNTLVFVPLILGGKVGDPGAWIAAALAFAALSLLASTTYLLNDLFDLADDRRHWSKRARPLASGRLPILYAVVALPAGFLVSFILGVLAGPATLALLAAYLAITIAYSVALKRQPILDAFSLAVLFTLRLGIGVAAAQVAVSPWLMVFSMFLFTSLSFAKRHTEVERMATRGEHRVAGRGYLSTDGPLIIAMGVASGLGAVLIMVLYLINDAFTAGLYQNAVWLWAFPPVLFLWIGRVWLLCHRGELHDDPVAFAVRDRPSLMLGGLMGLAFLAAWFGIGAG